MAEKAGSPGTYEFIIQMDPAKKVKLTPTVAPGATVRLEPGPNGTWAVAQELGEINMGSPHALWDFLKWSVSKHPAKRYALIIAGHGTGIFSFFGPGHVSAEEPGNVIFDPDRFVALDVTDEDCLTVFEMQAVLAAFRDRLTGGRPLDMLVFEACFPGGIEMLVQFRDLVNLVVSSPVEMRMWGLPYSTVAELLFKNPVTADTLLAKEIAESYVRNAVRIGGSEEAMAVYRTALSDRLAAAIDGLAKALIQGFKETGKAPWFTPRYVRSFGPNRAYSDLKEILNAIINGKCDFRGARNVDETRASAKKVLECLEESHVYSSFSRYLAQEGMGGLSIAWPEHADYKDVQRFYKKLDFAKATHWDELLDAWFTAPER